MNYFIETISLINKKLTPETFTEIEYLTPTETTFRGKLTNEGPSKYLMWCLAKEGKLFDKIIMLVTKECVEVPIQAVHGKTTYEYYIDSMKSYVKQLSTEFDSIKELLDNKYRGSIDEYIRRVFKTVLIPADPSVKESEEIAKTIFPNDEIIEEKTDIHLDFTGGSRVASLVSLLLVRILEAAGAKVKRIVYGNILDKPDRIIDLTENYNGLLEHIEDLANARLSDSSSDMIMVFKEIGLASEQDIVDASQIDLKKEEASRNLKKKSDDKIKKDEEDLDRLSSNSLGIAGVIKKQNTEKAKASNKASPFTKLLSFNDERLIVDFYEEVFGILCDLKVILCTVAGESADKQKEIIKNSIKANDNYYIKYNKKGKEIAGVLQKVKKWISTLKDNSYYEPLKTLKSKSKITAGEYKYISNMAYVKGLSETHTNAFAEYLIQSNTEVDSELPVDIFKEYSRLQIIYFNCGFPFMCMGANNSEMYPEIKDYYLEKVKKLMTSLDDIRLQNKNLYINHLNELLENPSALEKEIPYMVEMSVWDVNKAKFNSDDDKKEFITMLCKRIEKVRPYRNAISHKIANEYSALSAQKAIAAQIREWLREYENAFVSK